MAALPQRDLAEPAPAVHGRTFKGMGTTMGIWSTDPALLPELDLFLRTWVARVEAACSRFLPDSDLSRANATTGSAVKVGRELVGVTLASKMMAELTDGLYDPTVGVAVVNAGYDRTFEAVRADGPGPLRAPQPGAWWLLDVDPAAQAITVPEGYALDLGGSAKGWSVDVALAGLVDSVLARNRTAGVCISAGGDLAVAGVAPRHGWSVRIADRLDGSPRPDDAEVHLVRGAIATSGPGARSWQQGSARTHHLIDPRTGRPGESEWSLVSVLSDSCLVSDTTAKAAWLLGSDGPDWVEDHGLAARFVHRLGYEVVVGDIERWLAGGVLPWH